jgi:hypothetical protein
VSAEADKVQTGLDRVATAADVVLAEADKVQTALDRIATAADKVATNADVVLTAADVVLAEADRVSTAASASTATTQASTATTKASEAATSATGASSSASSATTAQAAAESARDSALAAFDSFDDRYLGQKSSNPSVDNDGNTLVAGTLYFNTTSDVMFVYEGSSWVAAYASLSGALLVTNNLSDLNNAGTSRTNLGVNASSVSLPKAGGAMTGAITTNSTFDGVDIATRDGVLTSTTTTAAAALPKAGGAMTGAITTNSTFDGRDVATDGTKLDTIATNANNYSHPSTHSVSEVSGLQALLDAKEAAGTAVAMAIALGG